MRGFAMAMAAMLVTATAAAAPPRWDVDEDESRLAFVGRQNDNAVQGGFGAFDATIRFSPDDLGSSSIRIEVDMSSVVVEGSERQQVLEGSAWLAVEDFPVAVFTADGIEAAPAGGYRALGTLAIKGLERPVPITFDVVVEDDRAVANGRADLVRTDFDVGPAGAVFGVRVAPEVEVLFHIEATRVE